MFRWIGYFYRNIIPILKTSFLLVLDAYFFQDERISPPPKGGRQLWDFKGKYVYRKRYNTSFFWIAKFGNSIRFSSDLVLDFKFHFFPFRRVKFSLLKKLNEISEKGWGLYILGCSLICDFFRIFDFARPNFTSIRSEKHVSQAFVLLIWKIKQFPLFQQFFSLSTCDKICSEYSYTSFR